MSNENIVHRWTKTKKLRLSVRNDRCKHIGAKLAKLFLGQGFKKSDVKWYQYQMMQTRWTNQYAKYGNENLHYWWDFVLRNSAILHERSFPYLAKHSWESSHSLAENSLDAGKYISQWIIKVLQQALYRARLQRTLFSLKYTIFGCILSNDLYVDSCWHEMLRNHSR